MDSKVAGIKFAKLAVRARFAMSRLEGAVRVDGSAQVIW